MMDFSELNCSEDIWHGFRRHVWTFQGRRAWVVEPETAAPGLPWSWCLEWAENFVERVGIAELLRRGFHHVHIDATGWGNAQDMKVFADFQSFLVERFGLAAKAALVGMSFGGLYSLRYAALYPDNVACAYVDAPLCNFAQFRYYELVEKTYGLPPGEEPAANPQLPINQAEKLKDLPLLVMYGADDLMVNPAINCELLVKRIQDCGGKPVVRKRELWGHHPHGMDNPSFIVEFIERYAKPK